MKSSLFFFVMRRRSDEAVAVYLRHEAEGRRSRRRFMFVMRGMGNEAGGFTSFVTPSHAAG